MRQLWRRFLAYYRLDLTAVCEMSDDDHEYHDFPDDADFRQPVHGYSYTCERCGRKFII
jgi:hypothetical protein